MSRETISPLIQDQFPEFFKEDQSLFPKFMEKYYEYLETIQIHFVDLQLNEYQPLLEDGSGILLEEGSQVADDTNNSIILESFRDVENDGFTIGEIVTGSVTNATGKILGVQKKGDDISGHSDNTVLHHLYVKPLTGKFNLDETITGSFYRTTAKIKHFDDKGVLNFSRQVEEMSDVFSTDSDYVELFRKEYLENINADAKADLKRLVTIGNEVFRTRGSEKSYNWLWKTLYNDENLEFEYPKDSLFKISSANWKEEAYLIVNNAGSINVGSFSGRTITGEVSGATGTVQSQTGFQRTPYELTKLFVTDIEGTFQINEKIIGSTVEGVTPSGLLMGVLDKITIDDGGTGYQKGDPLIISGGGGFDIQASVNTVTSGAINDIIIADGGDGYLGNEVINYFIPSGGDGAASETRTFQQSGVAKVFGGTSIVNNFTSVTIDAANYGGTLDGHNANTHFHSNALTTFDMTVGSTANYAVGHTVKDSLGQISGTVISIPDATSIIYAIEDETKPNFYPGDNGSSISAFKADGSAVSSTTTTVSAVTTVSDSQFFGALPLTTETPYGTIKTIEILTVGADYDQKPELTVERDSIVAFENNDEILGERSRFLNFDSNIEGLFQYGAEIQGADSGASATILDPYLENTSNTIFSTLRFRPTATLLTLDSTDGSSDAGDNILLEDGFHNGDGPQHSNAHSSYNSSTSIAGQYRLEDLDFFPNETIDATIGSANALSSSSNTVAIDNSFRGKNAVIQTGNLATGSISSLSIENFGVAYSSLPTITANTSGDQNAKFTASIGTLAQQPGGYTNESSLLSGKDKIQDSYYYQDFSYVLKTNTPINQFRDPVKTFVHPAGWALFGEIAVQSTLTTPFQSFTNTEDNSRLIIELAAQNVNFLSASSDVFEMTLRFIESSAAIEVNSTYNAEYIYKFKDPGTGVSVSLNTSDKEYHKEVEMITGELVANPITSDNHIESSLTVGMTLDESNVTGERILYPFIGQTSFANARLNTDTGDYLIRTTPSIQDWIDSFQVPDTNISNLGAYMSLVIGDLAAIEPKVANNSEIYLADINIALEDDNLLINSTDGSADDGDEILLEDGYDPTDSNYTASASLNGAIIAEAGRVLQEDELAPSDAGYQLDFSDNGKLVIHQSEDHKYMVTSVNSTAFTVQTQNNGEFLNTNLNEWNVEHKFADNIA